MSESGVSARPAAAESGVTLDDVVRTGPGTLAGRYLRRYWQPVYHSADIAAGEVKPTRVMGESFTLYRGASGAPFLLARGCPHRGLQLSAGSVEGEALRCLYHGWKFGGDGQCLEQPAEDSRFADRVRVRAFPARDYLGFVFAYLGEGEAPEFPRYPEFEQFAGVIEVDSYLRECNFFQNLENLLDQSHIGFVHGVTAASFGTVRGRSLKAAESEWGLTYTYTRDDGQEFVVQLGMPNIAMLATLPTDPEVGFQETLEWWVPVDDTSHIQFTLHRVPVGAEGAQRIRERREARRREVDLPHQRVAREILAGRMRMSDVDPNRCDMVRLQDDVAQIGQRRIADRSREHPGTGDVGLIAGRRLWRRELAAFAEGRPGKGWKRPAGMRPAVWGVNFDTPEGLARVDPLHVDMRPCVEVEAQMAAFGAH